MQRRNINLEFKILMWSKDEFIYVNICCLFAMQVLRYDRGGSPLWVTDYNILHDSTTVPCCERCGATRHFEFQVNHVVVYFLTNLSN